VLIALLAFGALSDRIGRRPVLAAGLGLAVVSTAVFLRAGDLALLFVGRLLSGLGCWSCLGSQRRCRYERGRQRGSDLVRIHFDDLSL
jgi:MFS family permease